MESRNKLTMCRLCLCENECFINIFELNDWQGYVAAEVISDLLKFQVFETDGYSHVVCSKCLMKLKNFKLFKECCQKSKVVYDNMFVSRQNLEKHKPEMPIIKEEELDIDSSGDGSDEPFEGTNTKVSFGPILLKHEMLSFNRDSHEQEKLIESDVFGNEDEAEPAATPIEDSTQVQLSLVETATEPQYLQSVWSIKDLTVHPKKQLMQIHIPETSAPMMNEYLRNQENLSLSVEVERHMGFKPYKCAECSSIFSYRSNLKRHMILHTGYKPFTCSTCSKGFSQSSSLKRHLVVHTKEKPHECLICRTRFSDKGYLKIHLERHCKGKRK